MPSSCLRDAQNKEKVLFIQHDSIVLPLHFKTGALNHSATLPSQQYQQVSGAPVIT
jgi:hypothetical protein